MSVQAQLERTVRLVCSVTGEPFYPVKGGGKVLCSQCGHVFSRLKEGTNEGSTETQGPSITRF